MRQTGKIHGFLYSCIAYWGVLLCCLSMTACGVRQTGKRGGDRISAESRKFIEEDDEMEEAEAKKETGSAGSSETERKYGEKVTDESEAAVSEEEERFFRKDGKSYEKVTDLIDGKLHWASVLTEGKAIKDKHGCEHIDYNSQMRSFECLDSRESLTVRRWDNLLYSAGDYLVFEYDGTVHVSKYNDLYHPVLSYDVGATHGIITKIPDGYMIADDKKYTVIFYNEDFSPVRTVENLRSGENGSYYNNGLMAVRDMKTGLMGYLDEKGELAISCQYQSASDFSNGYASVLTGASLVYYTEDGGTVSMFDAAGGQWGILDTSGAFAVEPSERFANGGGQDEGRHDRTGVCRFSPVREDKTVDFLAYDPEERVVETIRIP